MCSRLTRASTLVEVVQNFEIILETIPDAHSFHSFTQVRAAARLCIEKHLTAAVEAMRAPIKNRDPALVVKVGQTLVKLGQTPIICCSTLLKRGRPSVNHSPNAAIRSPGAAVFRFESARLLTAATHPKTIDTSRRSRRCWSTAASWRAWWGRTILCPALAPPGAFKRHQPAFPAGRESFLLRSCQIDAAASALWLYATG